MSTVDTQGAPDTVPPLVRAELSSALTQLRLKLLDLTGRNGLINSKHTAGKPLQFFEGQQLSWCQV